jgi:hypothetical protein
VIDFSFICAKFRWLDFDRFFGLSTDRTVRILKICVLNGLLQRLDISLFACESGHMVTGIISENKVTKVILEGKPRGNYKIMWNDK